MTDFILDENNDIIVENSSFKTGDSFQQEVKLIMQGPPGSFRENGYLGMDLLSSIDDDEASYIISELKKMLRLDGKKLNYINTDNDVIQIDVDYAD
jgi:hypothetical protein